MLRSVKAILERRARHVLQAKKSGHRANERSPSPQINVKVDVRE